MIIIKTIRNIILNDAGEMKLIVKNKLEEIKLKTETQITCVGGNSHLVGEPELPQSMDIEIFGPVEQAEKARLLCLSLLDELVIMINISLGKALPNLQSTHGCITLLLVENGLH